MGEDLERLQQRLPLLEYLQRHNWTPQRRSAQEELVGLCPLHQETRPSFYVNAHKNLFYCHGCGRGGDLIRFVELFLHLSFRQSVAHLEQELAPAASSELLAQTAAFYQFQLHCHPEAAQYLAQRGLRDSALLEELGLGYAPGGNLRCHLAAQGYSFDLLLDTGLINHRGHDAFCRRVIFPCREYGQIVNLYGRSIGAAFPHRLLPRSKGGLFAWGSVRHFSAVILVEGLFDLAVLWQAGFRNTTCAIGTHLTPAQIAQLGDPPGRWVYIVFDQDEAGQRASRQLAQRLKSAGLTARIVPLPEGHDPNSYFAAGATAASFTLCLQRAQPPGNSPWSLNLRFPPAPPPIACWTSRARNSLGPMPFSMPSAFANCRCARSAPMLTTCCTSPAGGANGRCHSLCRRSPSRLCSTTSASNLTRNRSPRPPP